MVTRDSFLLLTSLFVIAVLIVAYAAERWALAVYALSFWHFLVYGLAFLWRKIEHQRFIQDGVLLKGLSLSAFALVLLVTVPTPLSAIVMAIGFIFITTSTRALGAERTYYGYELAALPHKKITGFPYSLTAHPMLIGNMLVYGGTLLDDDFRRDWWPLGVLHVGLNLLMIVTEAYGKESWRDGMIGAVAGLAGGGVLLLFGFFDIWPYALATVVLGGFFGVAIIRRYA